MSVVKYPTSKWHTVCLEDGNKQEFLCDAGTKNRFRQ